MENSINQYELEQQFKERLQDVFALQGYGTPNEYRNGHPTYGALFATFTLHLTNDPDIVAYTQYDKHLIVVNKNLAFGGKYKTLPKVSDSSPITLTERLLSMVIRHEILHNVLHHLMRLRKIVAAREGVTENIDKIPISRMDSQLSNLAGDYEISNVGYTNFDKRLARNVGIQLEDPKNAGRLITKTISGCVTDLDHPEWVNYTFEQLYNALYNDQKNNVDKAKNELKKSLDNQNGSSGESSEGQTGSSENNNGRESAEGEKNSRQSNSKNAKNDNDKNKDDSENGETSTSEEGENNKKDSQSLDSLDSNHTLSSIEQQEEIDRSIGELGSILDDLNKNSNNSNSSPEEKKKLQEKIKKLQELAKKFDKANKKQKKDIFNQLDKIKNKDKTEAEKNFDRKAAKDLRKRMATFNEMLKDSIDVANELKTQTMKVDTAEQHEIERVARLNAMMSGNLVKYKISNLEGFKIDLARLVASQVKAVEATSYDHINKKYLGLSYNGQPIIVPGRYMKSNPNIPKIDIYVDTSGSISPYIDTLKQALSVIYGYEKRGQIKVKVYYVSDQIDEILDSVEKVPSNMGTGGGANGEDIYNSIVVNYPTNVIILTDGDTTSYLEDEKNRSQVYVPGGALYVCPNPDYLPTKLMRLIHGRSLNGQYIIN